MQTVIFGGYLEMMLSTCCNAKADEWEEQGVTAFYCSKCLNVCSFHGSVSYSPDVAKPVANVGKSLEVSHQDTNSPRSLVQGEGISGDVPRVEGSSPSEDTQSQESLRGEKLDEMPDYETPNRVIDRGIRIPHNGFESRTHPDSFNSNQKGGSKMENSKLNIGVGTEEAAKMDARPVKVISLDIVQKEFGGKQTDQLMVMIKHPAKQEPISLYSVSYQKGNSIKHVGWTLYYDSTGSLLKGTAPAEVLRLFNLKTLSEMIGKDFPTTINAKGYLSLKAY